MQFSQNLHILYGNITKDPELRYTSGGTAKCSFSVATNRSIKRNDQWEKVATFHNIVCWGKLAEWVSKNFTKGSAVFIQGRVDNRSYETQTGEKKYITETVADIVLGQQSTDVKAQPSAPTQEEAPQSHPEEESQDDGIPF